MFNSILDSTKYEPLLRNTHPQWVDEDHTGDKRFIVGSGSVPIGTADFYQVIIRRNFGIFIGYRKSNTGYQLSHGPLFEKLVDAFDTPNVIHPYTQKPFGLGNEVVEVYSLLLNDQTFTTNVGQVVDVDGTAYQVLSLYDFDLRTAEPETEKSPCESVPQMLLNSVPAQIAPSLALPQDGKDYSQFEHLIKQRDTDFDTGSLQQYRLLVLNEYVLPGLTYIEGE